MHISFEWLSDFVEWKKAPDPFSIADRLTLSTAEIEEVEQQGKYLDHCVVGKVLAVRKHPGADKLSLVDVETDRGAKKVVCGGSNLREGMLVAFAHIGATVKWHGEEVATLAKATIRGEESEGMICTAEELGLEEMFPESRESVLIDLEDRTHEGVRLERKITQQHPFPGAALLEFLGLTDTVFVIANTAITHRPDLFSHIGFARECVALGLAEWKSEGKKRQKGQKSNLPAFPALIALPSFPKTPKNFRTINAVPDLVPYHLGCTLSIDSIGTTPEWMMRRLAATGWRPVNLPVDITNYVTMELGMPLHSFDRDDLKGDVHIRTVGKTPSPTPPYREGWLGGGTPPSREGTKGRGGASLTTLDNVLRDLPEDAIVLSDDSGIFDLLGIMGGLRSSTKETTRNIYLHAAIVDPVAIRRTILATGHRTEASTVYEKGVPPITAQMGFHRALQLFIELVPGAKITSACEEFGKLTTPRPISLSTEDVVKTLGMEIKEKEIVEKLERIGCTAEEKRDLRSFSVTPPPWRLRDLTGPHDLIEEVGRLAGYDKLEPVMPVAPVGIPHRENGDSPQTGKRGQSPFSPLHRIRDALKAQTFFEIVPLTFVSPVLLAKAGFPSAVANPLPLTPSLREGCHPVEIQNPLGPDMSLLQPGTLPHLLAHAERELPRTDGVLRTFHCAHVFHSPLKEFVELGLLYVARDVANLKDDPFLLLKQAVTEAVEGAGYHLDVLSDTSAPNYAHPGRCAAIVFPLPRRGREHAGLLFTLHPRICTAFGLPESTAACTLNLTELFAHAPKRRSFRPLPQFPVVTYDETIPMTREQSVGSLLEKLRRAHALLESVDIVDVYQEARCKLTLRFTYRAPDRTLTEADAKKAHGEVMRTMG